MPLPRSTEELHQLAQELVDRAVARRTLDEEVERICRRQAETEVRKFTDEATALVKSMNALEAEDRDPERAPKMTCEAALDLADTLDGELQALRVPRHSNSGLFHTQSCSSVAESIACTDEGSQGETAKLQAPSAKAQLRPAGMITQDPHASSPQPKSRASSSKAGSHVPGVSLPVSPSGSVQKHSRSSSKPFPKALEDSFLQVPIALNWEDDRCVVSEQDMQRRFDGTSAEGFEEPKLSTPKLKATVVSSKAHGSISWKFAGLVLNFMEACHLARQVRGLKAAAVLVNRRCVTAEERCAKLKELRLHECEKSFSSIREVRDLRHGVAELRRSALAGNARNQALNRMVSQLRQTACKAQEVWLAVQAETRARELVQDAVLKALTQCVENGSLLIVEDDVNTDVSALSTRSIQSVSTASLVRPPSGVFSPVVEEEEHVLTRRRSAMLDTSYETVQELSVNDRSAVLVQKSGATDLGTEDAFGDESPISATWTYPTMTAFPTVESTELDHLKTWIGDVAQRGGAFASSASPASGPGLVPMSPRSGLSSGGSVIHSPGGKHQLIASTTSELGRLLVGVLAETPKLLAASAPSEIRYATLALADTVKNSDSTGPDKMPGRSWSVDMLAPWQHAQVLREGVAVGVVDPAMLAAFLAHKDRQSLRQVFCARWVDAWLGPYLEGRSEIFGPTPSWDKRIFTMRAPQQQFWRQCGRVIVDAMRDLFGKAMRLTGVEQEGLIRLMEEFAAALCSQPEIKDRFSQAQLPPDERPREAQTLEQAVFLLGYHALLLNTALHNPSARGRAASRQDFTAQGKSASGMQPDTCKKIYDLIKACPLGA